LTPHGSCVIAGFTTVARLIEHSLLGSGKSKTDGQRVGLQGLAKTPKSDLLEIRELLETGKIVPVIDRTYPLSQTADAIRYLETQRARGKVIVTVAHADQS
jgi:NADPH:quinone reductase-like Zn-dependent oxidoreductase